MAKQFAAISPKLQQFIAEQSIFFVGTARREGRVNVSPKGMDTFRVLDANTVVWLNLTGSGNETAIHIQEHPRMTIMFCSFTKTPLILRLYGTAAAYYPGDALYEQHIDLFPDLAGSRQIVLMQVELVQTSCGFAVPLMELQTERSMLERWAEKKGEDGIKAYWEEKNQKSIDGFEDEKI